MNSHAHNARQQAHYFQVPLCALAFGVSDKERLETIIAYGVMATGTKQWTKLSESQRREFLDARTGKLPRGFKRFDRRHLAAVCGADKTDVSLGSLDYMRKQHMALAIFRQDYEQRHGSDALVRLKTDLVFEARDGVGIIPRELWVLAAIYSIIGRKQGPVLITQDRIRCRALGYKTQAVMAAELSRREDGAKPLSDWQLRSLLDRLQARKFFARVTYGRRLSYYSHRMTEKELRKAVVEMKTFRFENRLLRQFDDKTMTDTIRNQRATLTGQPPPVPDALPPATTDWSNAEDVF
jgi:hypothetical protein